MDYKDIEEKVDAAVETVQDAAEAVCDKLDEAADAVSDAVEAIQDKVEASTDEVQEKADFVDDVVVNVEAGASKAKEFVSTAYDKAKDYSGVAIEKGKEFVGTAVEKSKGYASTVASFIGGTARDLRDTTRMSIARTNEKATLKRSYEDLGKLYYEVMSDKAEGEFLVCCNNIKASLDKISDLTAQIEAIRSKSTEIVLDDKDVEELDEIQAVVEGKAEEVKEAVVEAVDDIKDEIKEVVEEVIE